jgi:hypothetical protein
VRAGSSGGIDVLVAATRQPTATAVPVWISWPVAAGIQRLDIETSPAAVIAAAESGARCATSPAGSASSLQLAVAPGTATTAICVVGVRAGVVHVLVRAATPTGEALVAQSAGIEFQVPAEASFWERPGVSTLLSALVGFVFGLLSTALTTGVAEWREARASRRKTEKWVIDHVLPEMREHALAMRAFERADRAARLTLSVRHLSMENVAAALAGDVVWRLAAYLPSVRGVDLRFELQEYALALERHNREVDALGGEPAASRDLTRIERSFAELAAFHRRLGLRPS